MWLPLWFTYTRNSTLEAVLAGRYANIRLWRGGFGKVAAPSSSGNWVGPEGVEPGSDGGEALTNQGGIGGEQASGQRRSGRLGQPELPAPRRLFPQRNPSGLGLLHLRRRPPL